MIESTFLGNNPGAVRHGNFINYYSFHPPEYRISCIFDEIWKRDTMLLLDVGCNSGGLTQKLYDHYLDRMKILQSSNKNPSEYINADSNRCYIIGLDLDPTLIERAREGNNYKDNIFYECLDFMSTECEEKICEILKKFNKSQFDCIFAFSVSMWIHLNHGDEGLKNFITKMCNLAQSVLIEPQPWKCYLSAVRRLKKAGSNFPHFEKLKLGQDIESDIENLFSCNNCEKTNETVPSKWARKVFLYRPKRD